MNRKVKFITALLVAGSIFSLAACSNEGGSTAPTTHVPTPEEAVEVSEINIKKLNVGLLVVAGEDGKYKDGETFQLEWETLPRREVKAKLVWSSSDVNVATVDEKGLISAVAPGAAVITATSFDGKVSSSINVNVALSCSKSKANNVKTKITSAQTEQGMLASLDKICVTELFDNYSLKNGNLTSENYYKQLEYISKSEGYFRITSDDKYIKTEGGSSSFKYTEWIIYTTADYDTYLFHINGNVKTYMVADTSSAISKGQSRFEAMCSILDSLFTSGSGLVVSCYPDCLGEDELKNVKTSSRCGTSSDSELIFSYDATYENQTAELEEEQDYYIPAGTKYDISIGFDNIVENNKMQGKHLVQTMSWKLGNDSYSSTFDIEYDYKTEGVELYYPDKAEFSKVADIFEL